MNIGIAIPTYKNHINSLPNLLEKISKSTILPLQVSVSISSINDYEINNNYPFELIITINNEKRNPSENRNIASSKLTTDIISFIDGDDYPHPQRNEFIINAFKQGANCVVHDYDKKKVLDDNFFQIIYDEMFYYPKYINTIYDNPIYPKNKQKHYSYHCAHISISNELNNLFKFDENPDFLYKEDSFFCRELVKNNHHICYINNKLSQYIK
jgi:glycosyltransferase involved in cell wall biosynthesis